MRFETLRDKTEKVSCAPREDSYQHSHPPTLICVFYVRCIDPVNPEIFARILFSRISIKDIFATLKFATRA